MSSDVRKTRYILDNYHVKASLTHRYLNGDAHLVDINEDGFKLNTTIAAHLALGDMVKINLSVPQEDGKKKKVEVLGTVLWLREDLGTIGGRFIELNDARQKAIAWLITQGHPDSGSYTPLQKKSA